mmetsp:Transcript_3153/g.9123  ORF Transcript_3153/g.9123 Transcript_3153/m.9123 type:complete len:227 (-) Transcript_3153:2-682(-)
MAHGFLKCCKIADCPQAVNVASTRDVASANSIRRQQVQCMTEPHVMVESWSPKRRNGAMTHNGIDLHHWLNANTTTVPHPSRLCPWPRAPTCPPTPRSVHGLVPVNTLPSQRGASYAECGHGTPAATLCVSTRLSIKHRLPPGPAPRFRGRKHTLGSAVAWSHSVIADRVRAGAAISPQTTGAEARAAPPGTGAPPRARHRHRQPPAPATRSPLPLTLEDQGSSGM